MEAYCRRVALVPWPEAIGRQKRKGQLLSLVSPRSWEDRAMNGAALGKAFERMTSACRFDLVSVETPFLAPTPRRLLEAGTRLLVDAHNVEFDLARQYAERSKGLLRRVYNGVNWKKLRTEEIAAWRAADGVAFTSPDDEARAKALVPGIRSTIVPNGVDLERFLPPTAAPASEAPTVLFFGTMNYLPNLDAVRWLLAEIWPQVERRHPTARLQIIGSHPPPDVLAAAGPRVEIAGQVDDIGLHLGRASVVLVPLRIGGGTRLKILESLAMARPVVSTALGAEGIGAISGEHLLLADDASSLAREVVGLLDFPLRAGELGRKGRALIEGKYDWKAIGDRLESFIEDLIGRGPRRATRSA